MTGLAFALFSTDVFDSHVIFERSVVFILTKGDPVVVLGPKATSTFFAFGKHGPDPLTKALYVRVLSEKGVGWVHETALSEKDPDEKT